jgi:hypothetical protein
MITVNPQDSPAVAYSRSSSKQITFLLLKSEIHCRVHDSPPMVSILNQIKSVHIPVPYFFKIHFYIIIPLSPKPHKWPDHFRFSDSNFICISHPSYACFTLSPSRPPYLGNSNKYGGEYKCRSPQYIISSSLISLASLDSNIPLRTLF